MNGYLAAAEVVLQLRLPQVAAHLLELAPGECIVVGPIQPCV
jgi:hypothetical protein